MEQSAERLAASANVEAEGRITVLMLLKQRQKHSAEGQGATLFMGNVVYI